MITQEKTEKQVFRDEIAAFCDEFNMAPTTFGVSALNNGNFVFDLDKPAFSPKLETVTKVRKWMRNQRIKRNNKNAGIEQML